MPIHRAMTAAAGTAAMIRKGKGAIGMKKISWLMMTLLTLAIWCGGTAGALAMIPQAQPGWFYSDGDDHEFLVTNRIIQLDDKDDFVKGVARSGGEKFIAVFVSTTHSDNGLKKTKDTLKRGGFNDSVMACS